MRKWLRPHELQIPVSMTVEERMVFHMSTRLTNGKVGLLVDPGSKGNAAGDVWTRELAEKCLQSGFHPQETKRKYPLNLNGVGKGGQTCKTDITFPIALPGQLGALAGTFTTPVIPDSEVPGLLGLDTMMDLHAILDMGQRELIFPGANSCVLKPGKDACVLDLEISPSGHLILPVDQFDRLPRNAAGLPKQLA